MTALAAANSPILCILSKFHISDSLAKLGASVTHIVVNVRFGSPSQPAIRHRIRLMSAFELKQTSYWLELRCFESPLTATSGHHNVTQTARNVAIFSVAFPIADRPISMLSRR